MKLVLAFAAFFSLAGTARAEIQEVTGPLSTPSSGSTFFAVRLAFPETAVGHCVQNRGLGEFVDGRNEPLSPSGDDFKLRYRCSVLVTTRSELSEAGVRIDQLGTNDFGNFGLPSTDPGSRRFLRYLEEGAFRLDVKAFPLGGNMASFYFRGSEAGTEGYYYVAEVTCDPWRINRPGISDAELRRACTAEGVVDFARRATRGSASILAIGIKSPYY